MNLGMDPHQFVLEYVGAIGGYGLSHRLQRIGASTILPSGEVVVFDRDRCELVYIRQVDGAEVDRQRLCGPLKTDRVNVTAMTSWDSELVLFDLVHRSVLRMARSGQALSRVRIAALDSMPRFDNVESLWMLTDSTALISMIIRARLGEVTASPLQIRILLRDGSVLDRGLIPSRLEQEGLAVPLVQASTCLGGTGDHRWLASTNAEMAEYWLGEPLKAPRWLVRGDLGWTGPVPGSRDAGGRPLLGSYTLNPVCGDSTVLVRIARNRVNGEQTEFGGGVLEMRDERGRVLLHAQVDDTHEILFHPAVGWYGDQLFIRLNKALVPRIAVFRIHHRTSAAEPLLSGIPVGRP